MESRVAYEERVNFSDRLKASMVAAGVPVKTSQFTHAFNVHANDAFITPYAARKWLVGEALPTQERLHVLANWLKVSPQWLRFGEGPVEVQFAPNDSETIPHDEVVLLGDFRRLDQRSKAVVRDLVKSLLTHHPLRK